MREILIFKPAQFPNESHGFWTLISDQRAHERNRLQRERDEAAVDYAEALRKTFLLDPTYRNGYSAEIRAGAVLHDAERRLDRQVTQALADLEAARRLRP